LSILPGTSVFASSDTRSISFITAPTAKTSQVGCTMTRFQGDSPVGFSPLTYRQVVN
jgi:hypothetical protein